MHAIYRSRNDLRGAVVLALAAIGFASHDAVYGTGYAQAPLTSAVISMELTDNHDLAIPIIAACLLGRAFSSLLCKTPIYRALAIKLLQQHDADAAAARAPPS